MAKIYANTKFPKTKSAYNKTAGANITKLKDIMSQLVIKDEAKPVAQYKPPPSGGRLSYGSSTKKKVKTFVLN